MRTARTYRGDLFIPDCSCLQLNRGARKDSSGNSFPRLAAIDNPLRYWRELPVNVRKGMASSGQSLVLRGSMVYRRMVVRLMTDHRFRGLLLTNH